MFLAKVELDYMGRASIEKRELSEEAYHKLREAVPVLGLPFEYTEEKLKGWWPGDLVCDERDVEALTEAGIKVTIGRLKGLRYDGDRGSPLQAAVPQVSMISVAGSGLLSVREVTYREDCCTDALQQMLDDGWRILAVCPPNDTRRPDYILGRYDSDRI